MCPRTTDPTSERMRLFASSLCVCHRERFMCAIAARTSCSISREKGKMRLYSGHSVFGEWQFRQLLNN
jgi:hypothetical protein